MTNTVRETAVPRKADLHAVDARIVGCRRPTALMSLNQRAMHKAWAWPRFRRACIICMVECQTVHRPGSCRVGRLHSAADGDGAGIATSQCDDYSAAGHLARQGPDVSRDVQLVALRCGRSVREGSVRAAHQRPLAGCSDCTDSDVKGHRRWLEIALILVRYKSQQTKFLRFKASEQTCTVPTGC